MLRTPRRSRPVSKEEETADPSVKSFVQRSLAHAERLHRFNLCIRGPRGKVLLHGGHLAHGRLPSGPQAPAVHGAQAAGPFLEAAVRLWDAAWELRGHHGTCLDLELRTGNGTRLLRHPARGAEIRGRAERPIESIPWPVQAEHRPAKVSADYPLEWAGLFMSALAHLRELAEALEAESSATLFLRIPHHPGLVVPVPSR